MITQRYILYNNDISNKRVLLAQVAIRMYTKGLKIDEPLLKTTVGFTIGKCTVNFYPSKLEFA